MRRRTRPTTAVAGAAPSIGDALDAVRWDYDSEGALASPLVSTQHFFRDFPWSGAPEADGEESGDPDAPPPASRD